MKKKYLIGCAAVVIFILILISLDDSEDDGIELTFIKEPEGAVINTGLKELPTIVSDPCVIEDEMGFHLFYTTPFFKKDSLYHYSWDPLNHSYSNFSDMTYAVGYAFSADKGLTWEYRTTPVFTVSNSSWESRKIETPNVVQVEDELYLFYCADGYDELNERFEIGVATLDLGGKTIYQKIMTEGAMFDRNGRTTPLIARNPLGHFDMNVQEPSVVFRDNQFEVYYVGLELSEENNLDNLSLIVGIGMGKAVFNIDLELISREEDQILGGVNIIELQYVNDVYYLFYTIGTDGEMHKEERIEYRVSKNNGKSWSQPTIILTKGDNDSFDNWGLMAPSVVFDENDIYLFYTGFEVYDFDFQDLDSLTRFGVPFDDNTKLQHPALGRAVCYNYTD